MVGTHPPVPPWDDWNGWNFSVMPIDGSPAGQTDAWRNNGIKMVFRGVDVCPQDMWDFRMGRRVPPIGPALAKEAAPVDPRRFTAALAAMQGLLAGGGAQLSDVHQRGVLRSMALGEVSFWAVCYADSLLDELGRKGR